jgi:acetyl-CoA carboxylase biotin carboxyl carrier protein
MTDRDDRPTDLLDAVCRHVPDVLASAVAPPRLLRLSVGEVSVELEWPEVPAGPPVPSLPAGPDGAPAPGAGGAETSVPVVAPVVGAFYRAPSPGAAPFVAVGDVVQAGQQVGIVEAMKTMIPVEAPAAGRVAEVLVADGEPVEYGQALLRLEPVEVASSGNGAASW